MPIITDIEHGLDAVESATEGATDDWTFPTLPPRASVPERMRWAELMRRVFGLDVLRELSTAAGVGSSPH